MARRPCRRAARCGCVLKRTRKMAVLRIADEGVGIPTEIREKIFDLYFTTKSGGSGIGLAMTYRILQLHHGSVDVQSKIGRGTEFRLRIPLAATEWGRRHLQPADVERRRGWRDEAQRRSVAWLLPLLLTGCVHKTQSDRKSAPRAADRGHAAAQPDAADHARTAASGGDRSRPDDRCRRRLRRPDRPRRTPKPTRPTT